MKKFSLFLMIVLIVGAFFISCSAEPANDSSVATVALSLDTAKGLSASSEQYLHMYGADELYWFYKASKADSGFNFGATAEWKPLYSDSTELGIPSLIGYKSEDVGALFSIGNWNFEFAGYTSISGGSPSGVQIYSGSASVPVSTPDEETLIGGHAEIALQVENDPRNEGRVRIKNITVDFGETLVSNATYNMNVYVDDVENPINIQPIVGTMADNSTVVTFAGGDGQVFAFNNDTVAETLDPGFHTLKFEIKKGTDGPVYARGEITIATRFGYELTIKGSLANLDTVAYVEIDSYTGGTVAEREPVFEINNLAGLKALAAAVNAGDDFKGVTIKLTADINLSDEASWTPIGNSYRGQENGAYFAGTFDGQGNTISGLKLATNAEVAKDSNGEYVFGLFGVVKNATIKNLNMTNVQIDKVVTEGYYGENVAAVVGYSEGSLTLDNITVGADGDGSYIRGAHVAGVISRAYGKTENAKISITNCTNYAAITATDGFENKAKAAGIAAFVVPGYTNASVTITGCSNHGTISSSATQHEIAAGIASYGFSSNADYDYESITIKNNTNNAQVSISNSATLKSLDNLAIRCSYEKAGHDTEDVQHGN